MEPEISVIIPAYNEENYLSATLESLESQTLKAFEVIVVANGCTDNTINVARSFSATVLEIPENNTGKARNKGAAIANTNRLVFLDADTRLSRNALAEILQFLKEKDENTIGTCLIEPELPHFKARVLSSSKNALHRMGISWGGSGVIFCHRDLFDKVQFNEKLKFREDGNFVRSALRYGKYYCLTSCFAVPSLRKLEQQGYVRYAVRWVRNWINSEITHTFHAGGKPRV